MDDPLYSSQEIEESGSGSGRENKRMVRLFNSDNGI